MPAARTVLLLAADKAMARRFLPLLASDIAARGLAPLDRLSRRWRFRTIDSGDESSIPQVRISAPSLSTLPDVDLVVLDPTSIYREAERLAHASRGEASLGPLSAVICVDGGDEHTEWAGLVRTLVDVLSVGPNPVTRGRIQASFALVKLNPHGQGSRPEGADADSTQTLRLANEIFAATRDFAIRRVPEAARGGAGQSAARAAGDVLRWSLTILNPFVLTPGVAAAIGRAPAPTLWSYALVLFALTIIAPNPAFSVLETVCTAAGLTDCSASAALAGTEVADFDLTLVGAALGLAMAFTTLVPRRLAVVAIGGSPGSSTGWHSVRWSLGLIAGCWTVLLFPRSILAIVLLIVSRILPQIPEPALGTALDAEDFRGGAVIIGLAVTLMTLSIERIRVVRHERALHRARMQLRTQLASRRTSG